MNKHARIATEKIAVTGMRPEIGPAARTGSRTSRKNARKNTGKQEKKLKTPYRALALYIATR